VRRIVEEALHHADHIVQGLPDHDGMAAPSIGEEGTA